MVTDQAAGRRRLTIRTLRVESRKGYATDVRESAVDRRSGRDRRSGTPIDGGHAQINGGETPPAAATSTAWPAIASPFVRGPELGLAAPPDPWASVVRRSLDDYAAGRLDELVRSWDDALAWRVVGDWPGVPLHGVRAVIAYHQGLEALTDGSFRQEVLSIGASGGPLVEAHLRTTAKRDGRRLDLPSLLVVELVALRVHRVTEIPGEGTTWDRFWAD
jgi:ketosteroid isomerase-like protein